MNQFRCEHESRALSETCSLLAEHNTENDGKDGNDEQKDEEADPALFARRARMLDRNFCLFQPM